MAKVLIVYASDYGNTKKMAEAILQGAKGVAGTDASLKSAEEVSEMDLLSSDGIIVGSPVHMGSVDWRIKKLIDTLCSKLWMADSMVGKVGAVFASGSGYGSAGGGCELTMLSILANFVELGMLIVPLPKNTPGYHLGGLQWGPYARSAGTKMEQTGVCEECLEAARHHGANVARVAALLKDAKPLSSSSE